MARNVLKGSVKQELVDTGIPVIRITTDGGIPVTGKEDYIDARIEIRDANNEVNNIDGKIEIRGRGNTTWTHPKKPYRIKFSEKKPLFGLEKAKNWVLLANYQDPTLIMNTIAFELGLRFGVPFPHHYKHVEVILNGVYQGSYLLTELNQVGKGRVEIDENTGFLVELDSHYDKKPKFKTDNIQLPVMIVSPEDLPDKSGYQFVKDAINELDAAMFSESFPNTNYRDLIDMDVFIDFIMINEIVKNEDFQSPKSVFMYRDGKDGSKIGLGPLWDFDYGFGGAGEYFKDSTGMFYTAEYSKGPGHLFFGRFFEDPNFRSRYKERWNEKYAEIAGMETFIDQMAASLEKSHKINFKVWWWNKVDYKKEIERMKSWWRNRIEYLNKEINEQF
ncbi:MAG: CotH kinase family protein [Treponema sp.]|nr:CotH kinase family protein [Treponema sp.]